MAKYTVDCVRDIVFCGHKSAGKTTLIDRLLTSTGMVNRPASVDDGTSICDFDEEEKLHRYTIESAIAHFDFEGLRFGVLDTPGYPDFIGQTIGAMRAADTVAVVINAQSGIEVNTRRVFNEAGNAGLGRVLIVNKMDGDNIDFEAVLENIRELFGSSQCVPVNVPIGHGPDFRGVASTLKLDADASGALLDPQEIHSALVESIVSADDDAMMRYLDGEMPSDEEIASLMVRAVQSGDLIPIFFVSAKTGTGVEELIRGLGACCASPVQRNMTAKKPESDEEVTILADPDATLSAQVFKVRIDPFVQRLSYMRIFSGKMAKDMNLPVVGSRKPVKIAQLFLVQAGETIPVDEAGPGDIVAVTKCEDLGVNASIGEFEFSSIPFPTPMVGLAASPKARGDEAKLSTALTKLSQEDQTFRRELDTQTKEIVIYGMSELHLSVLQERLKRRDKVELDTREPKIPYRETIQVNAEGMYRHKKQSGGRGQFGEVHIRMFPFPPEETVESFATKDRFPSLKETHYDPENHFLWIDSVVGGSIPGNFMPAIDKGFRDRLERGVIAGYKIKNLCIEVHFGKYHPVDSSEQAFKTAASMAFRNIFQQAKPTLLEPIVKLEVTVPGDKLGDINSDLSGRRGRVLGMASAGGDLQTISAEVPLAEVSTYARSLASITGGQGSYTIDFSHYDVVPGNVVKEIVDKSKVEEEEEEE